MRKLAFLVLLAVLPTVELTEQAVHAIAHLFEAESPDHSAHHDESHRDEHGCTGLVHLCSCHHTQVTAHVAIVVTRQIDITGAVASAPPRSLSDLISQEPAQRPPIA